MTAEIKSTRLVYRFGIWFFKLLSSWVNSHHGESAGETFYVGGKYKDTQWCGMDKIMLTELILTDVGTPVSAVFILHIVFPLNPSSKS